MVSGEEDFTRRVKSKVDLWWIKGVILQDPTIAACLPTSIENAAIAYDALNDRFKVDIEAMTVGTINTNISDRWARQLGQIDLAHVLGAALSHSNPVIARLTDGSAFIDPRDMIDRAARLVGIIYGDQGQLLQRATTKDLLVQLRHNAAEIDPRAIRALTSSDIITAYGSQTQALLQRATTYDLLIQLRHSGAEIDPRNIRALTSSDVVTAEQATAASLKATVTQAEKDRTITGVSHDGTAVDLSHTFAAAGSWEAHTVTAGKKVRVLFISLELSAAVNLGYRFAVGGTIWYLRTTAGPYVSNLVFCTNIGATDEDLFIYASGACVIKGYAMIEEV